VLGAIETHLVGLLLAPRVHGGVVPRHHARTRGWAPSRATTSPRTTHLASTWRGSGPQGGQTNGERRSDPDERAGPMRRIAH